MGKKQGLDIVLYVDGLPLEWDWFETAALGGSETSGLSLAKELAALGHKVTLFCRCQKQGLQPDGVEYRAIGSAPGQYNFFQDYITLVPNDILILQRIPEMLNIQTQTKVHILWMHDLAWGSRAGAYKSVLWNIDKVVSGSKFATQQVLDVYGASPKLYKTIPLGIEQKYWSQKNFKKVQRKPKHILYCSRPERGMDTLVYNIMPEVIKAVPDVVLHICGYDLAAEHMKAFYEHCYSGLAALGDNAINHGMLTKEQLYLLQMEMDAYIYPSGFEETFCLTAIEMQRCGVPFITTKDQGALKNTLEPSANIFIEGNPKDPAYHKEFISKTVKFLQQPESSKSNRRRKLVDWAKKYTWKNTAAKWEGLFEELFQEKTVNPFTVGRHFYKENDVVAARIYAVQHEDEELIRIIDEKYDFCNNGDKYVDYYNDYDFDPQLLAQLAKNIEGCARIQTLVHYITAHVKDISCVLDYGCGEGAGSYPIANISSDLQVLGVDVADSKISIATAAHEDRSIHNNVGFTVIPFNAEDFVAERLKLGEAHKYDCLVLSEVLEHIPDPGKLLDTLEPLLKEGAHVIMTTPYGPFETEGDLYGAERRSHLHNFDRHDYRELLGTKEGLSINFFFAEFDKNNKDRRLAHAFVAYKTNGELCGLIDYERKFSYVAPRQSVTACVISKNNEDTIGACIKSLLPVADQIIVMDTGSTDGTNEILKQFSRTTVYEGSSPIESGFETPRNEALQYANGDWILWLDTDETLIQSGKLHKYLRSNTFDGYAMQQHHFSCEPPNAFPPDLPVRLFRTGKGIQFYGMIHEHPEQALNEGVGLTIVLGDIHIAHPSYLTEDIRRARFLRNFPLLEKDRVKYPNRTLGQFFWMRDLIHRSRYILEQTGGAMVPEVQSMCQEAVMMAKEIFIPNFNEQHIYVEAMKYYSDACLYLGLGFEAIITFGAARQDAQPSINYKIRFADIEDYETFVTHVAKLAVEPFKGKYV